MHHGKIILARMLIKPDQTCAMTDKARPAQMIAMDPMRRAILAFYKKAVEKTGEPPSTLAIKLKMAHTTIQKFLKNPENHSIPGFDTIWQVGEYARISLPAITWRPKDGKVEPGDGGLPEEELAALTRDIVRQAIQWDRQVREEIDLGIIEEGAANAAALYLKIPPEDRKSILSTEMVKVMARRLRDG